MIALSPASLSACGVCVDSMVWSVFPAVLWTACILLVWNIWMSFLLIRHGLKSKADIATTVGLILLSILGIGVLGLTSVLGGGLLLLNLRIIQLLRGEYPPKLVRQFWGLSIVALVLTSIAVVHEYREQSKMSRVDRILRFEGGGPADQWAKNLVNSLPPPLPEIRELVQRGNNIAARVAVEKLGRVGDPDIDAQILFVRFQENRAYNEWWREDIEKAMKQLTDSPLPEGSSVEEWEVFLASWKSEREIESESESENEKTTVGS